MNKLDCWHSLSLFSRQQTLIVDNVIVINQKFADALLGVGFTYVQATANFQFAIYNMV